MNFLPSQLGINVQLASLRKRNLDEKKTIEKLFTLGEVGGLPYQHVRIPIPFDEIAQQKGVWDFSKRDWLINQALRHNKTIHLQFGAKTIGFPEVWVPKWLTEKHPYIHKAYACIDANKYVQEFLLETLEKTAHRYLKSPSIGSLQIENEAFCKRLSVSNYRYISYAFHQQELAVVKKYTRNTIPILQNLPLNHILDTIESLPYVFKNSDILGLNIYNQHIPSQLLQRINNIGLDIALTSLKPLTALTHKKIYITELQTIPWYSNGKPVKPFSEKIFQQTLKKCFHNGAEIVFLWDIEHLLPKTSLISPTFPNIPTSGMV